MPTVTGPNAVGSRASAISIVGEVALSIRSDVATPLIDGFVAVRLLLFETDQIEIRFGPVVVTPVTLAVRFWAPALLPP